MLTEMKAFFEAGELAQKAASSIRNGREIGLVVTSAGKEVGYTFTREGGKNVLRDGNAAHPDIIFTLPEAAAKALITGKFETIGQVGLHIFEKILSNDPDQKVRIRLKAGVLSLVTGGYLGVLTSGGTDVAKFLATHGLGSMGKLKDAISKMRG